MTALVVNSSVARTPRTRPVPEGMALQRISKTIHPSNIVVFTAASIGEAAGIVYEAVRAGKQGGVWLENKDLRRSRFASNDEYNVAVTHHVQSRLVSLKAYFQEASLLHVKELFSCFVPHIDSRISSDALDGMRGVLGKDFNKLMPIRIVDVVFGRGPVLFGRNEVIAAKLAKDEALGDPRILGTAYEVPNNATLFIASRKWGLPRALIHSSPNANPRVNNTPVRELSIYDCVGLI